MLDLLPGGLRLSHSVMVRRYIVLTSTSGRDLCECVYNTITLSFTPQVPALVQHLDNFRMLLRRHHKSHCISRIILTCIEQDCSVYFVLLKEILIVMV